MNVKFCVFLLLALTWSTLAATTAMGQADAAPEKPASAQSQAEPDWATFNPSPHRSNRRGAEITAIIIHYTAGGSLEGTVGWFRNPSSKVSSHYVVGRSGGTVQMVPLSEVAWHAGRSQLAGKEGVNQFSVGIEVCNWGKLRKTEEGFVTYTGNKYRGPEPIQSADGAYWEPFTDEQYATLVKLCKHLAQAHPVTHITGHSDIANPPGRKIDPGQGFQWEKIRTGLEDSFEGHIGPVENP
ncbi:MAG: N-acetylmuramoyl-L-alanine amidase [Pirellulaceae bacterium]